MEQPKLLILRAVCAALLAVGCVHAERPPNILLMMADDLGTGDIGCYGNTTLRTPNLDRIASEGARLTHHLSAASICTPSRAAFMTGRYPIRFGMVPLNFLRVNFFLCDTSGIPPNETTVGEMAKEKGYNTAFFGKWHLGLNCETYGDFCHHPMKNGFDQYFGMPLTNTKDFGEDDLTMIRSRFPNLDAVLFGFFFGGVLLMYAFKRLGFLGNCTFLLFSLLFAAPVLVLYSFLYAYTTMNAVVMRGYEVVEQPVVLEGFTDRLITEGVTFLEEHQKDDVPFLMVMSWIQVHTALHSTRPFRDGSQHGLYGDEVEELDWSVGQILEALDRLKLTDNTFVYFTSDHGGHNEETGVHGNREGGWNGIFRGGKGQGGMEGGIRVPGLVRWPGKIPPGSQIDLPTSTMDVMPTVTAMIQGQLPQDRTIDGVDIGPLLRGRTSEPPHKFLVHYCGVKVHAARYTPGDGSDVYKVHYITPNWIPGTQGCGFMCSCDGTIHNPPQMFNIARDPGETTQLDVTEPHHKIILQNITKLLTEHLNGVEYAESQFLLAKMYPQLHLQPCCNWPHCSCKEDVPKVQRQPSER